MQETQDYYRNFGQKYDDLDGEEEKVEEDNADEAAESMTVETLRAKIEEIPDSLPPEIMRSLQEALKTVEVWQGRSVRSKDWQRIINRLDQDVVAHLEVGRFSKAKENLDIINDEIIDLEDQSRS